MSYAMTCKHHKTNKLFVPAFICLSMSFTCCSTPALQRSFFPSPSAIVKAVGSAQKIAAVSTMSRPWASGLNRPMANTPIKILKQPLNKDDDLANLTAPQHAAC